MTLDMTTGSPIKKILRFFIPVLLGNLLQQLYSTADSVIVSHFIGVDAFAGVSATGSLNFLILGLALGMCSGFAIPVSQQFGAGDRENMRHYFANALYAGGVIAVIMAVVTAVLTPQILTLVGTPDDIFDYSCTYARIIFAGIPATVMYNLLSGVMRAVGDGRTPLIMLLMSSILNILLDLLLVVSFKMGIAGAAWATIISQFVSGLLCLYVIFIRTDVLKIRGSEWRFDIKTILHLLGIGMPMGLQFSITAIGSTILQSAVNSLGSTAVASVGAGVKTQFIFTTPLEALGVTMATYCGQNIGARKIDRVRKGVRDITIVMAIYCACAFALQMLLGKYIIMLFTGTAEVQILTDATRYLNVVMAFAFLLAIVMIYRNSIQGLGYSKAAMFAGIMELIGRVFVATVLVKNFGFIGASFANPMAWICADALLVPLYFAILKKYERKFAE